MFIIIGLVMTALGVVMLVFNKQIYNFTGAIDFVESRMPGYSQGFLKLFAVALVFLGIMFFTGLGSFITKPLGEGIQNVFQIGK